MQVTIFLFSTNQATNQLTNQLSAHDFSKEGHLIINNVDFSFFFMKTVKKAAEYSRVCGIPFPRIEESELHEKGDPSNCYLFRGDELTVLHFPLFNKAHCSRKKRRGSSIGHFPIDEVLGPA